MTISEFAQWTNVLFLPLLLYIVRLETRLARIEVLLSVFINPKGEKHGKEA